MRSRFPTSGLFLVGLMAGAPATALGQAQPDPWTTVGQILRTENVSHMPYHRYNLPRSDLTLRVGDVDAGAFGLGAWVGFSGEALDATMMGDLVLTSNELAPVLAELARQAVDVIAIHNHLAGATPELSYVHFHAHGNAEQLAARVERAIALTGTPRPVSAPTLQPVQIDTALVYRVLGQSGTASGTVVRLGFQLVDGDVMMDGRVVDPAHGHRTPINIQLVGGNRAVASGDFAVLATAAPAVVRALTGAGITATALHSHLLNEEPSLRYIHFWADAPLPEVLAGLRSAIDAAR